MSTPRVDMRRRSTTSVSSTSGRKTPTGRSKVTQSRESEKVKAKRRSAPSTPVDKVTMLLMEANEINDCLQKDYVFTKVEDIYKEECDTKIKVTNMKTSMSCVWDLAKLKERLVRMRKLVYASETESSALSIESAFYDPNDTWTKDGDETSCKEEKEIFISSTKPKSEMEERTNFSNTTEGESNRLEKKLGRMESGIDDVISNIPYGFHGNGSSTSPVTKPNVLTDEEPVKLTNKRRGSGSGTLSSAGSSELPAESEFLSAMTSPSPVPDSQDPMYPDKYHRDRDARRHSRRRTFEVRKVHAQTQTFQSGGTPFLTICKNMTNLTRERLQGDRAEWTAVDRLLSYVESLKVCVVSLLEAYTHVMETGDGPVALVDCELVRMCGLRLVTSLDLLTSHTSCWTEMLDAEEPSDLADLCSWVHSTVQELASELPVFLEACDSEDGDHTQDSASQVLDNLFELSKQFGALALATAARPRTLADPSRQTFEELMTFKSARDDVFSSEPGEDLKQFFLSGCDTCLGRTLAASVNTIEEWEEKLHPRQMNSHPSTIQVDVNKDVRQVFATSKVLVLKCQDVQKDVANTMVEDELKPADYFLHYYNRCLSLVTQASHVTNSLNLLGQASSAFLEASEGYGLGKVLRCCQILRNATSKMVVASNHNQTSSSQSSSVTSSLANGIGARVATPNCSGASSVLSDTQVGEVDSKGRKVHKALDALVDVIQRHLESSDGGGGGSDGGRTKRMLPSTPGHATTRSISSKTANKHRLSRAMSMADIALNGDL